MEPVYGIYESVRDTAILTTIWSALALLTFGGSHLIHEKLESRRYGKIPKDAIVIIKNPFENDEMTQKLHS